jgi:hypothetical protein
VSVPKECFSYEPLPLSFAWRGSALSIAGLRPEGHGVPHWNGDGQQRRDGSRPARGEFRAEFYNLLNQTNYLYAAAGPQNALAISSFGYVTAARPPRQLGLKFYY